MTDDGFNLPAIPYQKMDPQFLRQIVPDPTGARPGTVVVDTSSHHLYVVLEGGRALRYGVGLGRAGFEWSGDAVIQWKQHWPKWTPPDEMVARDPKLQPYSAANGGMPGGLDNPLGARALTCSTTARTRSTVCTARRNGIRSASRCRRAACA